MRRGSVTGIVLVDVLVYGKSRGVRSSDDGCQTCQGTFTVAISELQQQQTQVKAQDTQSNVLPLFYYH